MASRGLLPPNIDNDGRIAGGILRQRNLIETSIVLVFLWLFYKVVLFAVPVLIKYAITLAIGLPLIAIFIIGIGDLSVLEWLGDRKSFRNSQAIYPFMIPTKKVEKKQRFFSRKRKK